MSVKFEDSAFGIYGLVGIALVVLKLTGVIDWSWLWVTLPFWLPLAIVVIFFVTGCAIDLCCLIYREIKRRNSNKW